MARFTNPGNNSGSGTPGPAGPPGADGADGADALWNFVGEYDNGADYNIGDVVTYLGGTYYRVGEPNPGYPPGTVYWTTIAEPGADGATGPQGEPGVSGTTAVLAHQVKAGEALTKGQAVYVSSADGTNMIVSKASNVMESTSSKTMGLITTDLANNGQGTLITEGLLAGLNTATANAGDPVWLGTNGNLIYGLSNKPSAPAHLVFIGIVTRSNANNGEIFVKCQNGFEVNELHDVTMTGKQDGYVLSWNATSGLYEFVSAQSKIGAPLTLTQSSNHSSYPLTISSANEQGGGTGYVDIAKFTNSKSGATNINKHIRLNSTGGLEIVNNAYTSTIFHLADNGALNGVATYNGATLGDTGWVQITSFGSGWSAVGQSVYSRVINNVLYMRGNVYNATGSGTGAFTLPVGHRPATEMVFAVQKYGAGELTHITIGSDGVVVPSSTGAWLTGVTFPVN